VGKTIERLIQNRLLPEAERYRWYPESQHGFRPGRSTVDAIFVSRLVSSSSVEKQQPLYKCFVDLTKAYDKVDRNTLWTVLERRGVPPKLVQLIKAIHCGSHARVRVQGQLSEPFNLDRGLKQGSVFAPLLFNIFFGAIVEAVGKIVEERKLGLQFRYKPGGDIFKVAELRKKKGVVQRMLMELLFADDAALMTDCPEKLQQIVDVFVTVTDAYGQEVSVKKTEVMWVGRRAAGTPVPQVNIFIKDQKLKQVSEFRYVGSTESENANMDKEVQIRLQRLGAASSRMWKTVFGVKDLRMTAKLRTYRTVVLPNGIYASATWNARQEHVDKLDGWQYRTLRRILGLTWEHRVSYADILKLTAELGEPIYPMEIHIREARLRYLGHVERMGSTRLPYIALHGEVALGARRPGAPRMNFRRAVKRDLLKFGIPLRSWMELAKTRVEWRKAVDKGKEATMEEWLDDREMKSVRRQVARIAKRQQQQQQGGAAVAGGAGGEAVALPTKRERAHGLLHMLRSGKTQFGKVQTAVRAGHVVSTRGGRERAKDGKFPSVVAKMQQAHTNRLLHMLEEAENELLVLSKEATELDLMERARVEYVSEKSDKQGGKKRREMVGERGGKRRRVEVFMFNEHGGMYLEVL